MKSDRAFWLELFALVAILAMAFYLASIPRLNYAFPLHIDEWMRLGQARSIVDTGRISYPDLFNGGSVLPTDIEAGYHIWLAELQIVTGISWMGLFRYFPGIVFIMLVFMAYAFGKKYGYGLHAAFFTALVPTTVRWLGPVFLVPVSLGLCFIPLILLVMQQQKSGVKKSVTIFILALTLLFIHPPTFVVTAVIIILHQVVVEFTSGKENRRAAYLALFLLLVVFLLIPFWAPEYLSFVTSEAIDSTRHLQLPPISGAIEHYGYIPLAVFIIGLALFVYRGNRQNIVLAISAVGLLAFQLIYPRVYIGPDIIYERGWLYVFVLMSLIAGAGLYEIILRTGLFLKRRPLLGWNLSWVIIGLVVVASAAYSIHIQMAEPYYHVIDEQNYADFNWVKSNMPSERIALLDTAQAWAFAGISGKYAYATEVAPNWHEKGREAMAVLARGVTDTTWLREKGISLVYTPVPVNNPDLIKVNHNLYLVKRD